MQPLRGYASASIIRGGERLPVGGYVIKILDIKSERSDWGERFVFSFDIIEGEYKDFFAKNYRAQREDNNKKWKGVYRLNVPADDGSEKDQWKQDRFKTTITAFEESNQGYHWDWNEFGLKGKIVGALFSNKEYDFNGRNGFFTNCHHFEPVEVIRSGKFKIPPDQLLQREAQDPFANATPFAGDDSFMQIPDSVEDSGLPFN